MLGLWFVPRLFLSSFLACAPPTPPAEPLGPAPGELLLLHTNDLHCHYLPERADWLEGEPAIGGFVEIDAWVRALSANMPTLLLDGGDILTGTPLTDLKVRDANGGAMLELMEAAGYDAWALGNHEFDRGDQNLAALIAASKIPVVSSNVVAKTGGPAYPGLQPSVVLETGGLKVAVIGATTEGLTHLAPLSVMQRVEVKKAVDTVRAELERLAPEVDLVIALTHLGVEADRALAEAIPELDLIIGGHSHTPLRVEERVNGVPIVQAGSYGRSLGVIRLRVEDGAIVSFQYQLQDLLPGAAPGPASPEIAAMVEGYATEIDAVYGVVIGEAKATLGRSWAEESDLGNWVTDALRAFAGTDIGVYNSGGLRADLVAGPITRRSIYEILPFGNQVTTFTITGGELQAILLANALAAQSGDKGAIQLSGATVRWREKMGSPEIVEALVNGKPLDPDATYTAVSNSFVVERADRYLAGAKPQAVVTLPRSDFDVLLDEVAKGPVVTPPRDRTVQVK